jgi:signal transduction histidine kinase
LRGMNERLLQLGGSLLVASSQNGTTVTATVPVAEYYSAEEELRRSQDSMAS